MTEKQILDIIKKNQGAIEQIIIRMLQKKNSRLTREFERQVLQALRKYSKEITREISKTTLTKDEARELTIRILTKFIRILWIRQNFYLTYLRKER